MISTLQRAAARLAESVNSGANPAAIKRRLVRLLDIGTRTDRRRFRANDSSFGTEPGSGRRIVDHARRMKAAKFAKAQS